MNISVDVPEYAGSAELAEGFVRFNSRVPDYIKRISVYTDLSKVDYNGWPANAKGGRKVTKGMSYVLRHSQHLDVFFFIRLRMIARPRRRAGTHMSNQGFLCRHPLRRCQGPT